MMATKIKARSDIDAIIKLKQIQQRRREISAALMIKPEALVGRDALFNRRKQ